MRGVSLLTLGLSLAAHLGAAAALLAPRAPDAAADPPPTTAGETFELPAPDTDALPLTNASPSPATIETSRQSASLEDGEGLVRPSPPQAGRRSDRASHAGRPSAGRAEPGHGESASTGVAGTYGAVGERSAADLATAFTRAFPQAASADPAWRTASFGSAGEADVIVTLDPNGHIEASSVAGAPPAALASGIRRTLSLIHGRPFVATGRVTRLHIVAHVSADSIHDGLHGDVFAIGGSYAGGEGSGFFALAIGRRVDLRVRGK